MKDAGDKTAPIRPRDPWVLWLCALTILALVLTVVVCCWPAKEVPLPARLPVTPRPIVTNVAVAPPTPLVPISVATQDTPRAVAVPDTLPLRYRVSPMLANFVDRECKNRVTADFATRVERVQASNDLAAVVAILKDTTDGDTVRNEAAKLLARSGYAELIPDLLAILMSPAEEPRFRSFCVQHLYENYAAADEKQRAALDGVFVARLGDPDKEVRRESILALVRLGKPEGKKAAEQWLRDPAAHDVRDIAIHCMDTLNLRDQAPEIRKSLHDTNNVVRIAAMVVLSAWGDTESRGAFEDAAKESHPRLQRAGKAASYRLDHPSPTNVPAASQPHD
ncbi:MAG: HEAT repeat domain-containing protein [bacterium]